MADVLLFVEDVGHVAFISEVSQRVAQQEGVECRIDVRNGSGGHGTVVTEFGRFLRDVRRGGMATGDVLIVAADADTERWQQRRRELVSVAAREGYGGLLVCAVPQPHVERWYMLDHEALRTALSCPDLPDPGVGHREKDWKQRLAVAFREAGYGGVLPGTFAPDIVRAMNLQLACETDDSFQAFLNDLRAAFRQFGHFAPILPTPSSSPQAAHK